MTYLGRRPAALAIRAYRRWLSGRGPLRRVCCTFSSTESCSAYGLRAVEDIAGSLLEAVRLVRNRIKACRRASVYRFPAGLGWDRDHELAPSQLVHLLVTRGEHRETIAQVLAARTLVARWRGDRASYAEAKRIAIAPAHRIPVRAGDAAIRGYRRTMFRAGAVTVLAALLVSLHVVAIAPVLLGTLVLAGARASAHRLEQQRVAAKFLRPATL